MFGKFKKTLNNALKEGIVISENLQEQYWQRAASATTPTEFPVGANVESSAGCELLTKYEEAWKEISEANVENAKRADDIATHIARIEQKAISQANTMNDLIVNLSGIPALLTKLKDCERTIAEIETLKDAVDLELEELQELCEECDLQDFMFEKQQELQNYKKHKVHELEEFRKQVETEHNLRLRKHADQLECIQRERHAVFDKEFQNDLDEYKLKGAVTRIVKAQNNDTTLEDVLLDNTEELNLTFENFLNE